VPTHSVLVDRLTSSLERFKRSYPFFRFRLDDFSELSEPECSAMADNSEEVPPECMKFASVKAKLDSKSDPFAGMTAGAQRAVRNAQIKRRMSTRHGQGPQGEKKSWF
jgi:hypothetical protein